ncbi:MAG TPA: phenylalanine--tRNA ligase subunit alpha, partial [Acidobacteriota bacterium]|nr:phenylalanine--tRNA ligase subunit alpha [Acidobacteriota bacterium]
MVDTESSSHALWNSFQLDLKQVSNLETLTEVRDKYLGRQRGLVALEMRKLGEFAPSERPEAGRLLNELKNAVSKALEIRQKELKKSRDESRVREEQIDATLPGYKFKTGGIHPIRRVWREMEDIFVRMGFTVVVGPEIESDHYNFEALNIPKGHPARDDQDTLYISDTLLLRTHTSPVQIRTMEQQQPPLRIVVPGRV